jgi:hypothetical protein
MGYYYIANQKCIADNSLQNLDAKLNNFYGIRMFNLINVLCPNFATVLLWKRDTEAVQFLFVTLLYISEVQRT